MLINSADLIGLKVETESGKYLGRIQSCDLEVDTQSVRFYYIKPTLLEGGVFTDELKIHGRQVVAITADKMIVVDNVVRAQEPVKNDFVSQPAA